MSVNIVLFHNIKMELIMTEFFRKAVKWIKPTPPPTKAELARQVAFERYCARREAEEAKDPYFTDPAFKKAWDERVDRKHAERYANSGPL